ncbi:MAG: NosD domain-containing protein [Candidatus Bathyarchaeia archaeon]
MKRNTMTTMLLSLLLFSLLSLTFNIHLAKTEPVTIIVPDNYPTIQEAINAANPGDTILVLEGTYIENIIVNKTITLVGENLQNTIIDGNATGTVVQVTADNVSISGFTIKNSNFTYLYCGVYLEAVANCNVSDNIIMNNWFGMRLNNSSNNILSNNTVIYNKYGIEIFYSCNNTLLANNMTNNQYSFGIWGSNIDHYIQTIDTSNIINSKPVYYLVNIQKAEVPIDIGCIILVNCTEITIKNLSITNNGAGIQLAYTRNSSVINCNFANNLHGIWLFNSSDNLILSNTVTENQYGIWLFYSLNNTLANNTLTNNHYGIGLEDSFNNLVYHNKFVNERQRSVLRSANVWDNGYPSGGNYWSDYTGIDQKSGPNQDQPGSDGIGDTPYTIDENNTDRYPLMEPAAVHDVAITNIIPSRTVVGQGFNFNINIQATNNGNRLETVNITIYINATPITQTINLTLGTTNITFTINTTGWNKGNYTINAYASPVPEENNEDNALTYNGTIIITVPGDTDGDADIDIYDIVKLASAYGSKIGEPRFKPNCDIDGNGEINIYDVVIATSRYGYKEQ